MFTRSCQMRRLDTYTFYKNWANAPFYLAFGCYNFIQMNCYGGIVNLMLQSRCWPSKDLPGLPLVLTMIPLETLITKLLEAIF